MASERRRRSPVVWLVLAALLLAGGAWLMRGAEPPPHVSPQQVNLPTYMSRDEKRRSEERRTWVAPVIDAGVAVQEPARPRDPVMALMPAEVKRGVVVAEFNAIMNSELAPKMTECLFGDGEGGGFLGELRDAGLDPTTKIDRVAMIDNSMVVTGDFRNAQWKKFLSQDPVTKDYGKQGQIHEITIADGGTESFATWGGTMFIAGENEEDLRRVLDRLEGSGPPVTNPVLDESMAYGELYGVMPADPIARMVEKSDPRLADLVRQSASQLQLHMDVGHDVGMVADIAPSNAASSDELRRSLGAALSVARMKAVAEGKKDEAELLDMARVHPAENGGGFRLEAGLPHDFMVKALDECIANRKREREQPADAGP
ncbi:MAG: hypothetical protein U0228_37415 [Myxococcaceae bacterium]